MTLQEIKDAVNEGKIVCWQKLFYKVMKDKTGQYLIKCTYNGDYRNLMNGTTLNGAEEDFYVKENC